MIYLITGATSFVGTELVNLLLNNSQNVIAVCRQESAEVNRLPGGVEVIFADMADYAHLDEKINHADVFINLAWEGTGHNGRDIEDIQKKNISCTIAAMHAAHRMGCRLFVESGSQAEYGSTMEPQREDMECHPFSEYGRAKLKVKEELFKLSEQMGMKYLHLRLFSIIGENDHPWTLVMSAMDKMLKDETVELSSCTQNWNFLYVKDAVKQIVGLCEYALAFDEFQHEVYNIASDDTRRLKEFVEEMKKMMTRSSSSLNYGSLDPTNSVSLQPDMSKTKAALHSLSFTAFRDVICEIESAKRIQGSI